MSHERPNADELLAQMHPDEMGAPRKGRLKIFLGAAPGVGKTYAMLEEARQQAMEGVDVLVGYAEPHIRPDTESLLIGLEVLPHRMVPYQSALLHEFDLDGALAKHPRLICVDELAHHNAPGQRHEKRWQDVFELLDSGCDVYATLNIQHLDSVKDIVEGITGVVVRETIPDEVLDRADEIELIDTTPDELTQRLRDGKVYQPEMAGRALRNFFTKGNLTALRELALRKTAEHVDEEMREARRRARVRQTWAASERVLVCVGPSPLSERLVRSARRLAAGMHAPWVAAYVETPRSVALSAQARARMEAHLRLAEQLGGEAAIVTGQSVAGALVEYARDRNVTKIVIGKPHLARWRERVFGSIVEDVTRLSGDIDVYVIRGGSETHSAPALERASRKLDWKGGLAAIGATAAATGIGWVMHRQWELSDTNVLMVYLLGVLAVSMRWSRWASALAAALSVLVFDLAFVPPFGSFGVSDREYIFTFLIMLLTGLLIGTLVQRLRAQAALFRERQHFTEALREFASEMGRLADVDAICQSTAERTGTLCGCDAAVLLPDEEGELHAHGSHGAAFATGDKERAVGRWALEHNQQAGSFTSTLPAAKGFYLPLRGVGGGPLGVLALRLSQAPELRLTDRLRLIEALGAQAATALERARLADQSRDAWEHLERENLRNTLLSAVSHDLRTPLTAIIGSASALVDAQLHLPQQAQHDLATAILHESQRMERVVANLLEMSRIDSGGLIVHAEPGHLGELVSDVVQRLQPHARGHVVSLHCDPHLPSAPFDRLLIDQVVTNLVENAFQHTPDATPISIWVRAAAGSLICEVADRGAGLPQGSEHLVFERFRRFGPDTDRRGMGLGLAIAQAIVHAHGGQISAAARAGGGAVFRFTLPIDADGQQKPGRPANQGGAA